MAMQVMEAVQVMRAVKVREVREVMKGEKGQRDQESESGGPRSRDQNLSWRTLSEMRTPRFFIVYNPR